MPLSWNEIRQRAITFSRQWSDASRERAESQTFWNEFFHVFGRHRRTVANFEETVKNTRGSNDFIDLLWPGVMIAEHKSRGRDLGKAHTQAVGYINDLINDGRAHDAPRYIVVSDFAKIAIHDLEPPDDAKPSDISFEFPVVQLHEHIHRFAYLAGYQTQQLDPEDPANIKAAELLANLHDRLEDGGYTGHDLQRFMVRILFCLFAEDTELFDEPDAFKYFILNHTREDGTDLGAQLSHLFQVLNTPIEDRQKNLNEDLAALPYVNGQLFAENLNITAFDSAMREALLVCCGFKWNLISPAIFGSLFQSIMDARERRQIGAHYTSERDILKLINSLFLDQLKADFERAKKTSKPELRRFHDRLASLNFLDPACGCGNFLVIAYRELRELELEVLKALHPQTEVQAQLGFQLADELKVQVSQMHGIEIEEWPTRIAEVALWLLDHQMNLKVSTTFGQLFKKLPLRHSPHIAHANALRIDWNDVLPAEQCSYIMGNPPFIGKKEQTKEQKAELVEAWHGAKGVGALDYVSAWYSRVADYLLPTIDNGAASSCRAAFVSTNSITQGEQVSIIWPDLFRRGIQIDSGHRTFPWTSEARGKAHVHVVIIGFGIGINKAPNRIYDYGKKGVPLGIVEVSNISPYLTDGPNLSVSSRTKPLSEAPNMRYGSMMIDKDRKSGDEFGLILNEESISKIRLNCPEMEPYIRVLYGGQEYINGEVRHCLWLVDAPPKVIRNCEEVRRRIEGVRAFRASSGRERTRELARTPQLFGEVRQPESRYLLIPKVSSENRDYIPIGFVEPEIIASGSALVVPDADTYSYGVLSSAMHNAWIREICGRMKSDYQYSARLVYNNYPWPEPTDAQKAKVEEAAQAVLDARENHPGSTLADLYDPLTMPADLAKAHAALDRAVDRCYRSQPFPDERRRFEHLFSLYEQLTAPLTGQAKKKTKRKKS